MARVRILVPVFFARFFDNEMADGAGSLRTSFFWLVSFLAVPGIFMPVMMGVTWSFVAQYYGYERLDTIVRADKVIYLGYGACAVGVVMASAWNALLLDRRDGLVLGGLPVNGREVVIAKLIALVGYIGLLIAVMHAGASIAWGLFLPHQGGLGALLGSTASHFITSASYGLFVCFGAVALQGLVLLISGERGHARLLPLLQLAVTAVVLTGFFLLGTVSDATVDTLNGDGPQAAPWILQTPTLWFLGLYEVILGLRDPIFVSLAWRAVTALTVTALMAGVSLPLSYRRLMVAAVEQSPKARRAGIVNRFAHAMASGVSLDQPTRAIADFFLTTLIRHNRPRLAIAISLSATIAWTLPIVGVGLAKGVPALPTAALLGTPLAAMFLLVIGCRMAASLPSELAPRWVFLAQGIPDRTARRAVRRIVFVIAVVTPTVIGTLVFHRWWPQVALPHALLCLTTGLLIVEVAFARFDGVPCACTLRADGANLRTWWPAYLLAFVTASSGLSRLELALRWYPQGLWMLIAAPLAAAIAVRVAAGRIVAMPIPDDDELPSVQVLNI